MIFIQKNSLLSKKLYYFHGTIIAMHEKPEFLALNKSKIRTFIQGNNCAMKNQSWMPIYNLKSYLPH